MDEYMTYVLLEIEKEHQGCKRKKDPMLNAAIGMSFFNLSIEQFDTNATLGSDLERSEDKEKYRSSAPLLDCR